MEYNGWRNYETWCVNVWLNNDQGSHEHWTETAQSLLDGAEGDKADASMDLAQMIEEDHDEARPEVQGVFADLLSAAMDSVDWHEIADGYLEDLEYEADEDGEACNA